MAEKDTRPTLPLRKRRSRKLSAAQLDRAAEIGAADLQRAQLAWRQDAPRGFQSLLGAEER